MNARATILKNLLRTVFGLFVFSIGVALEMQSNIGMAPWETLSVGISKHLPFTFGTVHVTISLAIVVIDLLMKEKIGWGTEDGYEKVCAKVPESREALSEESEILLVPYGCAKLRMTEIPLI